MESPRLINATLENQTPLDPSRSTLPSTLTGDRVLIDPIPPDQYLSAEAKIERPVGYKDPYYKGTIMNIGGSEYGMKIPESHKPGLVVFYYHQQALDFIINKKTYHLVRCSDIIAFP